MQTFYVQICVANFFIINFTQFLANLYQLFGVDSFQAMKGRIYAFLQNDYFFKFLTPIQLD